MRRKKLQPRVRRVIPQSPKTEKSTGFSYYANRDARPDQTRGESKLDRAPSPKVGPNFWINHVITVLMAVIVFAILADLFWLNANPNIHILDSSGTTVLLNSSKTYQDAAQKLIDSSFLNRNKLTINVDAITSSLQKEFPELASVSIQLTFSGHQAQIYLNPAQPVILLNNGAGGTVYAVDPDGVVIGQESLSNVATLDALDLPLIQDPNLSSAKVGSQALSNSDVSFIQYVSNELKAQHILISTMSLPVASRELDVYPTGQSYYVKFNLESAVKEQVGGYLAVRQYLTQNKITPTQYIDVRIAGRAYYK